MPEYNLKRAYRIEHIDDAETVQRSDAGSLWVSEGVLDPEEAERRTREVYMVGTDGEGELGGVSTAYLKLNRALRLEIWHVRVFVGSGHRDGNLAAQLLIRSQIHLNDSYRSGEDRRAPGMMVEVENPGVRRAFSDAVWTPTSLTYFGDNPLGHHRRLAWFDGARLPPPPEGVGV